MFLSDFFNQNSQLPKGAGWMGIWGSGNYRFFIGGGTTALAGTFTAPITGSYRVRMVGGGGGGQNLGSGGSGGGFSWGALSLTANTGYAYSVGAPGQGGASATAGGNTTWASTVLTAGGGAGNGGAAGVGGGTSASFTASGGTGSNGGGGAGSQLGTGGNAASGGGAPGGQNLPSGATSGGSPFGVPVLTSSSIWLPAPDIIGLRGAENIGITDPFIPINSINAILRFPFDAFTAGGNPGIFIVNGGVLSVQTGPGGGGAIGGTTGSTNWPGTNGGDGGGGGWGTTSFAGGLGGIGGGGGAGLTGANGGPGIIVVEW